MTIFNGTSGNDTLTGTSASEQFYAGSGNDVINTGTGLDVAFGGGGNDTINMSLGDSGYGDSGADVFKVGPEGGLPILGGGIVTIGGDFTGNDSDTLDVSALISDGWTVLSNLALSDLQGLPLIPGAAGYNGTMTLVKSGFMPIFINYTDIENFITTGSTPTPPTAAGPVDGTAGSEVMNVGYTDAQGDQIDGNDGLNDTIYGNAGHDSITSGLGSDSVYGGTGNDVISGDGLGSRSFTYSNNFDGTDPLLGATQQLYGGAPGVVNVLNSPETDADKEFVFVQGYTTAQEANLAISPNLTGVERVSTFNMNFTLDMASPTNADNVDGISINFGDMSTLPMNKEYENGVSEGLAIRLDPLSNVTEIRWNGTVICAGASHNLESRVEGTMHVSVTSTGVVSVTYAGDSHPYLVATIPSNQWNTVDQSGWSFGFAGRTGDNTGYIYIDDVDISSTVTGTSLDGTLGGNDVIDGGDGDDLVYGGAGNDTIYGALGNDSLFYGAGNDVVFGGDGNDLIDDVGGIVSTTGSNLIYAGAGNDLVWDGAGNDTTYGGDGADSILGDSGGDDLIYGDAGNDSLTGGLGNDTIFGGLDNDVVIGDAGDDKLYGNDGNDSLMGDTGNDTLDGGADNDTVDGGVGNDSVTGGAGNDSVLGGDGTDTLAGGAGNDTLDGGLGDDDIAVGGADSALGGSGDDVFTVDPTDPATDINATIAGGEVGEDLSDPANGGAGDVLDLSAVTTPVTVALTGEAGTVNGLDGDANPDLTFSEIEKVITGTGADTVAGGSATTPINVDTGAGNDTIATGSGNDTIAAGTGDDTVDAGAGNDIIDAGTGNDSVAAGAGDDTVAAGDGNDTVDAGAGNDSIAGGLGNDSLIGGAGNDTLDGGLGDDIIDTSAPTGTPNQGLSYPGNPAFSYVADPNPTDDQDLVYGGDGNDIIRAGDDNDTIFGGIGNDSIDGGFDSDSIDGGAGNDTLAGSEGRDTIYGGDGDDRIFGALADTDPNYAASLVYDLLDTVDPVLNNSTDVLYGGVGRDNIFGGDDADTLYGGVDNDTLDGGIDDDRLFGDVGSDSLTGGHGNDTLDGGLDDDRLILGAGDVGLGGAGDDIFAFDKTLTGATAITVTGGETGEDNTDPTNGSTGDTLNLAGLGNVSLVYDQTDPSWNGTTSEKGVASYLNAAGQAVTVNFAEIEKVVVCFAAGTMIETAEGEVAIESLQVGDLVRTADHDYQPIRWIGSSKVAAVGSVAPILIKAGALGNTRDLMVSPQHRMLLGGWQAEMLFGDAEVLVAAKHLVNDQTILRVEGGEVEYFHMLFDTHEIVFAEGAASESFHPGQVGWGALAEEARAEILALFPELEQNQFEAYGTSARRTLKAHEAKTALGFLF